MSDVTRILNAIEQGDQKASAELLPLVYDELRVLAAQKMAQESPGQTLQATALIHEAYLRLVTSDDISQWDSRGHFFAAAAEAMRRILVEKARSKSRQKRGGHLKRVDVDAVALAVISPPDHVLSIDDALKKLEREEFDIYELVRLRYFVGLSIGQAATALGISVATAYRNWNYARAWLHAELLDRNRP